MRLRALKQHSSRRGVLAVVGGLGLMALQTDTEARRKKKRRHRRPSNPPAPPPGSPPPGSSSAEERVRQCFAYWNPQYAAVCTCTVNTNPDYCDYLFTQYCPPRRRVIDRCCPLAGVSYELAEQCFAEYGFA